MEKEKRIFFISGHRDITYEEFHKLYEPIIKEKIEQYDAYFVIGDYEGVDILAQNYLLDILKYDADKVTVYHMFGKPRYVNNHVIHTVGNFTTDVERDTAMTSISNEDIAFVRKGRYQSGTGQNIIRRYEFYYNNKNIEKIIK